MTQPATKRKPFPLGQRIKDARKDLEITNARLAAELGVDQRTVAGWQATPSRSRPSYERLIRLAEVLRKPPSYFLDGDGTTDDGVGKARRMKAA